MSQEPFDPPTSATAMASFEEPVAEVTEFFDTDPRRRATRVVRRRFGLSAVLFLVTCASVFLAGFTPGGGLAGFATQVLWFLKLGHFRPDLPEMLLNGFVFCGCLMTILMAHEMGHFVQSVRHRVPATLPLFIPFPIGPFGTMGAVILQDGSRADRRQLFDIAISGPLAGLAVALPIAWYGVATSHVFAVTPGPDDIRYGDPLLLRWIVEAIHGPYGPEQDVQINAALFAGWVGIFITALNLLPVGQLDGGHILYTLVGRRAHYVAYAVLAAAISWMLVTRQLHYALIVVLVLVFGPRHPPTANDYAPLGPVRTVLGWLSLAFIAIGFTPTPIIM